MQVSDDSLRGSAVSGVVACNCPNRRLRLAGRSKLSSIMRLRQTTLSPWLRSLAALAVVLVVGAQAMCLIHCDFGGGDGNGDSRPSCHGSAQDKSLRDGQGAPAPAPTASCSALTTMLAEGEAITHYVLPSVAPALDASETRPQAASGRRAHSRDWIFTPEGCIGPAFRSLAPPFVG